VNFFNSVIQKVLGPFKSMNVSIKHQVEATPKLFKVY